jgi:hypothetical protein
VGAMDLSRAQLIFNSKSLSEIDDLYTEVSQKIKKNKLNETPRSKNSKRSSSAIRKAKLGSRKRNATPKSTRDSNEHFFSRYIHKNLDNITTTYFTTGDVGEYVRMTTKFILELHSKNKVVLWLTIGEGQYLLPKMHEVFSIAKTIPNYTSVTSKTYRKMIDQILELTQ